MAVNLNNTTPAAPTGSTNILFQKDAGGNVSGYVSSSPVQLTANSVDSTALAANVASTPVVTSPTAGFYRVSAYLVVTQVATTSSTLPSIVLTWSDKDNGQPQTLTLTPTNAGNLLTTFQQASASLSVSNTANITYSTTGYATSGATSMQYAIHVRVEQM